MARKSRGSKKDLEEKREKLTSDIDGVRKKIAKIRDSDISRLEKTRQINILRSDLSKFERELTDL